MMFLVVEKQRIGSGGGLDVLLSDTHAPDEYREWKGWNGMYDNLSKVYTFYANK